MVNVNEPCEQRGRRSSNDMAALDLGNRLQAMNIRSGPLRRVLYNLLALLFIVMVIYSCVGSSDAHRRRTREPRCHPQRLPTHSLVMPGYFLFYTQTYPSLIKAYFDLIYSVAARTPSPKLRRI